MMGRTAAQHTGIATRCYQVGDAGVRVRWTVCAPAATGRDGAAIALLPGWSLAAGAPSVGRLGRAFAAAADRPVVCLDSRADPITSDALWQQAEAMGLALADLGLRRVIVAGHSEGGDKAIDLAVQLQRRGPAVEGLILLDPVGLYDQVPAALAVGFAVDALFGTPLSLLRRPAARVGDWRALGWAVRVAGDLCAGLVADLVAAGGPVCDAGRVAAQVRRMARANPHMAEVQVPVILLQGAQDRLSNPRRLAPGGAGNCPRRPAGRVRADPPAVAALFPGSARVCHLVATKLGQHGVPLLRPEATARATLALLRRAGAATDTPA